MEPAATQLARMESHDYEHYRNLTLMFFFEKLLEKGGEPDERWMELRRKVFVTNSVNVLSYGERVD